MRLNAAVSVLLLTLKRDEYFVLSWCLCVRISSQPQFYPRVYVALHVTLLTYPMSTCTDERSFSGMNRLQTPLRSTMTDERLSSLAILHIHVHKHKDVIDIDGIITEFTCLKGTHLALCL